METIKGNNIVVPYRPDAKLTWVCCDDIGACAAGVLADPRAHASKMYPLVVDAASHAEIAELLSKVMGGPESYKVEQVDIKDWYKCLLEHGGIEVSNSKEHTLPATSIGSPLHSNCSVSTSVSASEQSAYLLGKLASSIASTALCWQWLLVTLMPAAALVL